MRSVFIISMFLIASFGISQRAIAQDGVGIGTDQVNPDAILEIESNNNKGILLPRMDSLTRVSKSAWSDGLTVYDAIEDAFYYFSEKSNGWKRLVQENSYGTVPLGGIIMWSGDVELIPDNFALCNSQIKNGVTTPDLTDRFVFSGDSPGVRNKRVEVTNTISEDYVLDGDCSEFEFLWSGTLTHTNTLLPPDFIEDGGNCALKGLNGFVDTFTDIPANRCEEILTGCPNVIFSDCTSKPNPNYYLGNPDCRVAAQYYELAFIMRVK